MAEEVWSNRTYTVWANNSGGSTSATFSLEVISQTPRLLYAEDLVLIAGDAMPSWQPFVLYGSVDTWAIEPDLPDGLVFSDVLGRITGTPTTPAEAMTWTVWTNATGVSVPWNLTITVLLDTDDDGMPNALPEGYRARLSRTWTTTTTACSTCSKPTRASSSGPATSVQTHSSSTPTPTPGTTPRKCRAVPIPPTRATYRWTPTVTACAMRSKRTLTVTDIPRGGTRVFLGPDERHVDSG